MWRVLVQGRVRCRSTCSLLVFVPFGCFLFILFRVRRLRVVHCARVDGASFRARFPVRHGIMAVLLLAKHDCGRLLWTVSCLVRA